MTKVATLPLMPMKRLMQVRTTYAVLGTLKRKEAGYIKGVLDQLQTSKKDESREEKTGSRHHQTYAN